MKRKKKLTSRKSALGLILFFIGLFIAAVGIDYFLLIDPNIKAATAKTNVILILADDMRPDEMDAVASLRPNGGFAWIKNNGTNVKVKNTDNLCCPGRTTILTGQNVFNHMVFSNDVYKDFQANTLPIWLQQSNYCTGFTGKYFNTYNKNRPRPGGWTYWEPFTNIINQLEIGYSIMRRNGTTWQPDTFITDYIAKQSRTQLTDCIKSGKPAFIAFWPFAPHIGSDPEADYANIPVSWNNTDPSFNEEDISDKPGFLQSLYPTPDSNAAAYTSSVFQKSVRTLLSVDDAITGLINEAKARNQLTNTVFILTSDNGYLLGEHRIVERKGYAYDAAQTAMWIAGPGFPKGVNSDAFVTNMDITRTILNATGAYSKVNVATQIDGRPLQKILADPNLGRNRFLPIYVPLTAINPTDVSRVPGEGVRTWRYTYIKYEDGSEELYDLFTDPYELSNAANNPSYVQIKADMIALSAQAKVCKGDSCRVSAPVQLQK